MFRIRCVLPLERELWLYSLLLSTYKNDMQGIWCSNTSFLWPLVVHNIKCSPGFQVTHEIITNGNRWPELQRKFRTFTIRTVILDRTKKRLWNPPNGPKAGNWVSFYIGIDVIIENYTWNGSIINIPPDKIRCIDEDFQSRVLVILRATV